MTKIFSNRTMLTTVLCSGLIAIGALGASTIETAAQESSSKQNTCNTAFKANQSRIEAAAKNRGGEARIKQIMASASCNNIPVRISRPPNSGGDAGLKFHAECRFSWPPASINCKISFA